MSALKKQLNVERFETLKAFMKQVCSLYKEIENSTRISTTRLMQIEVVSTNLYQEVKKYS